MFWKFIPKGSRYHSDAHIGPHDMLSPVMPAHIPCIMTYMDTLESDAFTSQTHSYGHSYRNLRYLVFGFSMQLKLAVQSKPSFASTSWALVGVQAHMPCSPSCWPFLSLMAGTALLHQAAHQSSEWRMDACLTGHRRLQTALETVRPWMLVTLLVRLAEPCAKQQATVAPAVANVASVSAWLRRLLPQSIFNVIRHRQNDFGFECCKETSRVQTQTCGFRGNRRKIHRSSRLVVPCTCFQKR